MASADTVRKAGAINSNAPLNPLTMPARCMRIDINKTISRLRVLSDVKHVITDGDRYYLKKLCRSFDERYDPCNCPDYHHDLAAQLYSKLKNEHRRVQ